MLWRLKVIPRGIPGFAGSTIKCTRDYAVPHRHKSCSGVDHLDWAHSLCRNSTVKEEVEINLRKRNSHVTLQKLLNIHRQIEISRENGEKVTKLEELFLKEALLIPNRTHTDVPVGDITNARICDVFGESLGTRDTSSLGKRTQTLRTDYLPLSAGDKSYILLDELALLEEALLRYTVDYLRKRSFRLISVPDIVSADIIQACGFPVLDTRSQVFRIYDTRHVASHLAGTGEVPLAAFLRRKCFSKDNLPMRLMTASRCFRSETSPSSREKGLYRVQQFNKVEMFGVTENNDDASEALHEEFLHIQKDLFSSLGLHCRVLDMPTMELGASAYRKYDIEAMLPGSGFWGEISSTSNCTDYQARRLDITYTRSDGERDFCHTLNGTACAIPRMLMAIMEQGQTNRNVIEIPEALHMFMDGKTEIPARAIGYATRLYHIMYSSNYVNKMEEE